MATIVLQVAGAAIGSFLGGPIGAVIGRAVGALAGSAVDSSLLSETKHYFGPRLKASRIMTVDEGTGIARVYGTARVAGQVIWMTRFEEKVDTERQGGKGFGPRVDVTTYRYFGNVAIGLCEGPIAGIRRIWADGEEMDLSQIDYRVYLGDETQAADPLIEVKQGSGNAPAYRGLAYLVFERLPLESYGNRIPQIACEVLRPIGHLEQAIRAVTLIPGASEHGLDPQPVRVELAEGEDELINRNVLFGDSDLSASLDELTALCPNLKRTALVVSWFGDDLRAGHCTLRPKVEIADRHEKVNWRVGDLERHDAELVSTIDGAPAYGGTPSDAGVIRAIAALRGRGLKVTFYPFVLMDVPPGNARADPYGGTEQNAFPWRGRISLDIAVGRTGSADGTAAARDAIVSFLGAAAPGDFTVSGNQISYHGPDEWSYRRMILHQAHLAAAGGADAFLIGSELPGLTRVRDADGRFPFVEGLIALAADVKTILPDATVTYAADWSEYFGYHPDDGSGDVLFNLDPLWASSTIDIIGIDDYLPIADWRDGEASPDAPSIYDRAGLAAGIAGGEDFDWYYQSDVDRAKKQRTPITDGADQEPSVFRAKDLVAWWSNPHYERRNGQRAATPTSYVPKAKPIWLTELGCPAVDKGANQPNVFIDPKSSESALPYFSNGGRDDLCQRRFLEAHLDHWTPGSPGFDEAANPVSPVYHDRMVTPDAIHLWTWDARPFPAFPALSNVWGDAENWRRGHWLNGRLGAAPFDALVAAILSANGVDEPDLSGLEAILTGWVESEPSSARDSLDSLFRLVGAVGHLAEGTLVARSLARLRPERDLAAFVDVDQQPFVELRRAEAAATVDAVAVSFLDVWHDYQPGSAEAMRPSVAAPRRELVSVPAVIDEGQAGAFAARILAEGAVAGETAHFALPASDLALAIGDVVDLDGRTGDWLVTRIETGLYHRVTAQLLPARLGAASLGGAIAQAPPARLALASRPFAGFLDLPLPAGGSGFDGARVAISASPFVGYEVATIGSDGLPHSRARVSQPAVLGRLQAPLLPGPEGRIDPVHAITVALPRGALASVSMAAMLAGGNLCAVQCDDGGFEVLQFRDAEEIATGTFRLSALLRAQGGTEDAMTAGASIGALFVLLDGSSVPLDIQASEIGHTLDFRVEPFGRALDDPAVAAKSHSLGARSVRPLSPVHLTASFAGDGAVTISWIRRTRIGGDNWVVREVPLGEDEERYRLTLAAAGASAAVIETTASPVTLTADRQKTLFGSLPAAIDATVAQVSPVWGAGTSRSARFVRPV
ncbi:glycoside hydrolase TIM-barrel-like domain-containing protein [Jiella sp. MQZ9-1]|uniref:Glycoside hydrolase TIM-barrel-like domain-containing protein n=1 Tax=Jiella flava TaxID=2816857 RepID=A0A939FUM8_9HYPH|nr:glycoside hydrolase TIM-barrel-like domain-containing protein [Jiella flava]MBO0661842.1 glycoside hydrolase TIM-barrel-like domain-containing protein [Jiella flava]MCD2470482.1 glycoside hydrolase TIM-barrel-like domain-containing protein [Jiella flava]